MAKQDVQKNTNSRTHGSVTFWFLLFWFLHLRLRVWQIRNWLQASKNCSLFKNTSMKSLGAIEARLHQCLPSRGGSVSGFSSNSQGCHNDSTVCCNQMWKGEEWWLECKAVCTTQTHPSFAKPKCPHGSVLQHVLLRNEVANQGVIAIKTTCDEQEL